MASKEEAKRRHAKRHRQDHLKKIKMAIDDYINSALIDYSFSIKYDSHTGGITIYQDAEDVVIELGEYNINIKR